jgi:hypothetical protein
VVFVSTHWHALVWVEDAEQLARFMQYVNGKLGKEVGRLVGWRHGIWSRRYTAILVSNEEKAQVARLKYLLGHGVKEFLVERAADWPGVNSVRAILEGKPLTGYWFDRKAEYAATASFWRPSGMPPSNSKPETDPRSFHWGRSRPACRLSEPCHRRSKSPRQPSTRSEAFPTQHAG